MLRATLEVSGKVTLVTSEGEVEVRIVSPEALRARAPSPFYTPLWIVQVVSMMLSRLRRWVRRDHRWIVVVAAVGAGNCDGDVRGESTSRSEAIDRAVVVAEELVPGA
jgi:hypothetical protein